MTSTAKSLSGNTSRKQQVSKIDRKLKKLERNFDRRLRSQKLIWLKIENFNAFNVSTNQLRVQKQRRGCFDFRKSADWRGFRLQIYPMLICNSCILYLVLSNTSAATSTIRYYLYLTLSRAFTTILVSLVRFLKGRIEEFTNTEFAFFSVE